MLPCTYSGLLHIHQRYELNILIQNHIRQQNAERPFLQKRT